MARPRKKPYHHGDLRRALIDAAIELIEKRGVHGLSLREAARVAKVSSGAPYRHFEDKDALLTAIAIESHELLSQHLTAEIERSSPRDPLEHFRAQGVAYVTFAAAHPVHFRLMCNPDILGVADIAKLNAEVVDDLVALVGETDDLPADAPTIALAGRSIAYGLARLIVDGQLPDLPRDPEAVRALALRVLDLLGTGLR